MGPFLQAKIFVQQKHTTSLKLLKEKEGAHVWKNKELMPWVIQYFRLLIKRTRSLQIVVYFPYLIFYSKNDSVAR